MIYSSLDDEVIFWTKEDLDILQKENFFYRQIGDNEEVGVHYVFEERCYMIITSANDTYGRRKLEYLLYILLITFSVGSVLVWSSTWILVKKLLAPLDDFKSQLVEISANKLNHRIKGHTNDELGTLANSFNSMIERLDFAFKSQKEFTANASHELKTPLTRISFQIEGMLENYKHESEVFNYLTNIKSEVHQMSP